MKLSTKKVVGIAVVTLLLMLGLLLVPQSLVRSYLNVAVLVAAVSASIVLFGWTKPRGNNRLVAILVVLSAVVFQVVMFLLLGLKLGWVQNVYKWNLANLFQVFLPITLLIVGEEVLRGQLVEHGRGSLPAMIVVGATLWLVEIITALPLYNLAQGGAVFNLIVLVAGPTLLTNVLLTYLAYAYDYRIGVGYRLVMDLPVYILPILPEVSVYLSVLFEIGLVVLLALSLAGVHRWNGKVMAARSTRKSVKRAESDTSRRVKRVAKWAGISVVVVVIVGYMALMSGLFRYHFLAIGSGSMEPNISRGDMVLVEKSKDYDRMKEGDILVYRYSNVVMVHRIMEIKDDGEKYVFRTKGDANGGMDAWQVEQGDIIGIARGKIAMFGFPTLWLNELFNGES